MRQKFPVKKSCWIGAIVRLIGRVMHVSRACHLSRSAAAVSYYLLLALFPMAVCVSVLWHRQLSAHGTLIEEAMAWMAAVPEYIGGDAWANPDGFSSTVIFGAALTLLLSASAGAYRCLAIGAAEITAQTTPTIQNDGTAHRFSGIFGTVFGYLFATALFFAVCAATVFLLLWEELTAWISHRMSANAITEVLSASRYLVLFLLFYALCYGLMRILPPQLNAGRSHSGNPRIPTAPGALFCTVGLCGAVVWFALFLRGSARYSLVYGSLASMILFLTWLYLCGNLLLLGIAVNAAITNIK